MKYILLKTDNTFEVVEIEYKEFLMQAHHYLDCSFIEIVNLGIGPFRFCIDDSGKCASKDVNDIATVIYNIQFHNFIDDIVGDVIIGKADFNDYGEYDFVGLDDFEIIKLFDLLNDIKDGLSD